MVAAKALGRWPRRRRPKRVAIRCVYHAAAVDDRVVGRWINDEGVSGGGPPSRGGNNQRRPVGRVISQQQLLESTVQLNRPALDMSPRVRRAVPVADL